MAFLVVDDDPLMRELISGYLLESDLRVSTAEGGSDMDRILKDHVVDLVLLDLRLDGEDGMQLARKLHKETDVPVIIVTALRDEADRRQQRRIVRLVGRIRTPRCRHRRRARPHRAARPGLRVATPCHRAPADAPGRSPADGDGGTRGKFR